MQIKDLKALLKIPENLKVELSEFGDITIITNSNIEIGKDLVEKVEEKGIYHNIYLNYTKVLPLSLSDEKLNLGREGNVLIEHTSVNPNKALHVGHLRNVYLGDFIYRAFKYAGINVKVANFIEDTGSQVADLILAFELGYKANENKKFDDECSRIYTEINKRYTSEENLIERKKEILKKIEENDKSYLEKVKEISRKVLENQLKTLIPQGIHYDYLNTETYLLEEGLIKDAERKLKEKGIVREEKEGKNKGCEVMSKYPNVILRRSDGTALYLLKDIAYAMWKLKIIDKEIKWKEFGKNKDNSPILISDSEGNPINLPNFDYTITLVDSRQKDEQNMVREAIKELEANKQYDYLTYEPVALSKNTAKILGFETDSVLHMSGRKGIEVLADDLIEKVKERIEGEKKEEIAYNVIKYSLLKVSPSKMIIFDIDEALNIKGNTGLYVTYTLARAKQILNKAKEKPEIGELQEEEKKLAKKMIFWKEFIARSINSLDPSILVNYLYDLCSEFNKFYEKNQVIGSEREKERLYLVEGFVKIAENIFNILGLIPLERI